MIKAACHCGAVRLVAEPPPWVLDCNCTLCRRYGAVWGYYGGPNQPTISQPPDPQATEVYTWQNGDILFHRCKACGCVTHMEGGEPRIIFGINMRMAAPALDPARTPLRQIDNGHSGFFWTRSDAPVIASRHPPMPPPGPDDWR